MQPRETETILHKKDFLSIEEDVFHPGRLYVYDEQFGVNGNRSPLLYLIFGEADTGIKEIVLYPGISKYLKGKSQRLLTYEAFNQNSDIVKNFTGLPGKRKLIIDIPILSMKSYSYYYPSKNFVLNRHIRGKEILVTFSLVISAGQ
jgi:hypothetical protein